MSIHSKRMTIALSAAALISGAGVIATAVAGDEKGKCFDVNTCKGQSACATSESKCAGQNTCKGKGWLQLSEKKCAEKDGKFEPFEKK